MPFPVQSFHLGAAMIVADEFVFAVGHEALEHAAAHIATADTAYLHMFL
jgi:hypothetical protein